MTTDLLQSNPNIKSAKVSAKPNLEKNLHLNSSNKVEKERSDESIEKEFQRKSLEQLYKSDTSIEHEQIDEEEEVPEILKEELGEDTEEDEQKTSFLDKFMVAATTSAVSLNFASLSLDSVKSKLENMGFGEVAEILDKILDPAAMIANKLQAAGFGSDLLNQAFKNKDATLLIAGFGKVFQVLMAGDDDFLQLAGIQTAFDQMKPGCAKVIGFSKFKNFGHSVNEYFKATKKILKEVLEDPIGYLTFKPKSGHLERGLVPGSMAMLGGTIGCMLSGENRILRTISSTFRHIIGGVMYGDYILSQISENKNLSTSGYFYGGSSIADTLFTPFKGVVGKVGHKLANMAYFVGEYLYIKGLKEDPKAALEMA